MSKRRMETGLGVIVIGIGLIPVALLGLWSYVNVTTKPFHPDPAAVTSVTHSVPSPTWAEAVERARQSVRASLAEQNLPGLSVAVGIDGAIVWAEGFGWSDLETRVPVAPQTRFKVGTTSKMLTSAAVGLLLEQGRPRLDDEIQAYVPEFPKKDWPVTLRQLMGHLSGIPPDEGGEEPAHTHCDQTLGALQRFAKSPLLFEPGTRFRYSSYGWILVSAAVEAAAHEPFATFMQKRIFEPLDLNDTTTDAAKARTPDEATYYFPRFAADTRYGPQETDAEDFSCFSGAGAFVSTPSDLVRFGMAIDSGKLLQAATVQLLQASQRLRSTEETGYGLGWDLETVTLSGRQTRATGYDGELRGGRVASSLMFPEHGMFVSVTSNISFADTSAVALNVAEAFVAARGAANGEIR